MELLVEMKLKRRWLYDCTPGRDMEIAFVYSSVFVRAQLACLSSIIAASWCCVEGSVEGAVEMARS